MPSSPLFSGNADSLFSQHNVDNDTHEELEMRGPATTTPIAINKHDEAALVSRLDRRLLCFAMLGNLVKTMDNTNINSAFISGMEQELDMHGVDFNWLTVLFMIGYLSMQIPSNMLLSRLRPSLYLPMMEIAWGVLTLGMACVPSIHMAYILRFFLGAFEAGFYPGIVFLVGTWYSRKELGKRNAWITMCGSLGGALTGLMQAGLLKWFDGTLGISGWRWMFVLDAALTFLLAIYGYKYLPDYPDNTLWLSQKERTLAVERLQREGHETKSGSLPTMALLRKVIANKFLYFFVPGWTLTHLAVGASHVLGIVAKKSGYDAITANLFTSPDLIISMLAGITNGFLSDYLGSRLMCILPQLAIATIAYSLLVIFVQPFGFLYFAFILMHASLAATAPVIMTWASEIIRENVEQRAISIAIMNTSSSAMYTWAPLVLWPVTDAPFYRTGFRAGFVFVIASAVCFAIIGWLVRKDPSRKPKEDDDIQREDDIPLLMAQEERLS
ncbi:hypothetical protein O0I10_012895 [Lichtheimia ornata]|uniref:Major facilitator superfamily (MFS) profile domain-containing protein n=1 Tax=Lichtheimia ornata TaxID=688661 RepID=A0AAD7XRB7_9FUNG|nr:uncharacterized protein O0I10_012895 [Lichtheimia ornata]KAJ8651545.1 hypothetical protein O0I10_012895 [Lichtheimia ornata]